MREFFFSGVMPTIKNKHKIFNLYYARNEGTTTKMEAFLQKKDAALFIVLSAYIKTWFSLLQRKTFCQHTIDSK